MNTNQFYTFLTATQSSTAIFLIMIFLGIIVWKILDNKKSPAKKTKK